ncbi:glycosyltransferase [Oricola sp.]|uniref:glycosyltransferase n=1 Tax=Oricola sp. TaxID=1979950 RepID=UPI0025E5225B|nr:glycosyltransferase [Oricola sp.]MCI5073610.1 glycosyltransferase family 4 protein [Oricola sp.]
MKTLFIAPMLPDDAGNGLAMRMGTFLEALSELGETDLLAVPVFGSGTGESTLCRRLGIEPRIIDVAGRLETHFALLRNLPDPEARLAAFRDYGKPSTTAGLSVPVMQDIRQFAAERSYDLIHVARSYLLPVIDAWPKGERPTISVDLDEDDAETHRRIASLHSLRGDAYTARWLEAEAQAYERVTAQWLPAADIAQIASEGESGTTANRHGIRPTVAVNTVSVPPEVRRDPVERTLLFVGGFGYFPNLDAAFWLLEAVLSRTRDLCGDTVSMTIVGRNPPKRLRTLAEQSGVELLAPEGDLAHLYARASIALVPLRAGGGSRIKLLEAAAHLVPIVATSAGAENSGFVDGEDIRIADTAEAIAEACQAIWNNPGQTAQMAAAARRRVEATHSRQAMISTLKSYFASQLGVPV